MSITYRLGRSLYVALTSESTTTSSLAARGPGFALPAASGFVPLPKERRPSAAEVTDAVREALAAEPAESVTFAGSAVAKPESWRKMRRKRVFSIAEQMLMDSVWQLEHPGGSPFLIEFRADAFNHFVCDTFPARAHWTLSNASCSRGDTRRCALPAGSGRRF